MPLSDEHKQGIRDSADVIVEEVTKVAAVLAKKQEELEALQDEVEMMKRENDEKKATVNSLLAVIGDESRYEIAAPKMKGVHRTVFKKCSFCEETMECAARQLTCLKCGEKQALERVEPLPQIAAPKSDPKPAPKPKPNIPLTKPPVKPYRPGKPASKPAPTTRRSENDDLLSDFQRPGVGKVKKGCRGCGKTVYVMTSVTICPLCPDGSPNGVLVDAK